jgi:hypothetical protein
MSEAFRRDDTVPGEENLQDRARAILDAHWQPKGYTVPNAAVYPHQWLWDSCFHSIAWAHLGEGERALAELRNVFAHQADDGFVPHMTYWDDPDMHADFWGRRWTSCLTQPPMYGHALVEIARRGIPVDADLVERAVAGLRFLVERRADDGLITIVHPWETGCDDSPRFDSWYPAPWTPTLGTSFKGELVSSVEVDRVTGSSLTNPRFAVGSAAFTALVAFNADELLTLTADDALIRFVQRAPAELGARWDGEQATVADSGGLASSTARTSEALLTVLLDTSVHGSGDIFEQLRRTDAFGAPFGPTQVHRDEPSFDPRTYWRGPTWPQLNYLFWVAARRLGRDDDARWLQDATIAGAVASGFAEYWDPDTGAGLGAVPQSWTALAAVMGAG